MGIDENEIQKQENKVRGKKRYTLLLLLLLLVSVTVGYAILSTNIKIGGKTKIENKWDISAINIECPPTQKCTINPKNPQDIKPDPGEDKGAIIWIEGDTIYFKHILSNPGDIFTFTVEFSNNGTLDAKISNVIKSGLNATAEKYLTYDVTYADGSTVKANDLLKCGEKLKFKVTIAYKNAVTVLPTQEELNLINEIFEGHTGATSLFTVEFVQK